MGCSGAVTFLVLFLAAAGTRVVATDVLQRIAHGLVAVIAMRPVDMVMVVIVIVIVIVIVVAVGTMHMRLLTHLGTTPE
jgi:multisubunit Na+/H+ antiporter MnhF subunit